MIIGVKRSHHKSLSMLLKTRESFHVRRKLNARHHLVALRHPVAVKWQPVIEANMLNVG